jgi:hypothetical protein
MLEYLKSDLHFYICEQGQVRGRAAGRQAEGRAKGDVGEMHQLEPQLPNVMLSVHAEMARREATFDGRTRLQRTRKPSWLSWQGGRLVAQLGNRLVTLGERLEQYEPVRSSL